ncbi:MAG: LamG domain-containing protein [Methanoregula sp.]|jgi:hypothetical protein|uniref:LamG domain-containing protein n=1 Tax=Methanoregula sp. TaxID=2052170 RepID=UPI003C712573
MSKNDLKSTSGVSEVAAEILIVILVVLIAVVAYAAFSGQLNSLFFKKSVYVAGSAGIATIPQSGGISDDVLTFLPKAGDLFYLTGQTSGTTGTQVTLEAISPTGQVLYPDASTLNGTLYGKTLYIYPNNTPSSTQCNYAISQKPPNGTLRPMALGTWTIRMIDQNVHVIAGTYTEQVKNGASALPVAGGLLSTGTGQFYDVNCNPLNETVNGLLTTSNSGPGGMLATLFSNGAYITIPDSTGLAFTGDMSISMWFDPTTAGSASNSGNWQQLIGKGLTTSAGSSSSDENDNYQIFQLGNQLLFEWNDATNGQHYQAITTTTPVTAGSWNYVTATVSGGHLTIYDNGVAQPLVYDNSNVPNLSSTQTTPPTPNGLVNIANNNNYPVNIGQQNAASSGNDFNYNGYIGSTALYNQALTSTQVAANYAGYTA